MGWAGGHDIRLDQVATVVATATATAALFFNWATQRRANKLVSAKLVQDCFNAFNQDPQMKEIFYKIEYDTFKYGDDFHGSYTERHIDKLLALFSGLAYLTETRAVEIEDLALVEYYFLRIYRNEQIREYLTWLKAWLANANITHYPYGDFETLGARLERKSPNIVNRGGAAPSRGHIQLPRSDQTGDQE